MRVHTSKWNIFNLITRHCLLVFSTTEDALTQQTRLVGMQAEDRPYKDGYHSYHLGFIQQLNKNQLILKKMCRFR